MNYLNHALCAGAFVCLLLSGTTAQAAAPLPPVVSVDMQSLMNESEPAQKGLEHLQKVKAILEKGYEDLRQFHEKTPQQERDKILADGLAALQRQMTLEKLAVSKIVNDIMVDEVSKWRKANRVSLVIDRASVIDGDMERVDFTKTILALANKRTAVFPDLPQVSITKPGTSAAPATPAKP